jgi:HSP20 family protein
MSMLPMRWDPMRDLTTLQREFDDLFRRVFGVTRERGGEAGLVVAPAVNSFIKDGTLHLEAELPGVNPEQLEVRVDGREVVIRGERRSGRSEEQADYLLRETRYSVFERRLPLPEGADAEHAHAAYRDGLLEITMPVTVAKPGGRKLVIEGMETGKKSKEVH